jgi:ribonuclease BN (tRNA processing enzyme)
MRITVLGGCGAWPDAGQACSGYLVEHDDFRLLIDPGYATLPRLLELTTADRIDAVFVTHGHPDHCADLNPLLRARALRDDPPAALPVYALPGALDPVLALDRPGMLADAYVLREFTAGDPLEVGPFRAQTRLLPHFVANAGVRLTADARTFAYTGDTGPHQDVVGLARDVDLLLAEATYIDEVPAPSRGFLTSARQAGRQATDAAARHLVPRRPPGQRPAMNTAVRSTSPRPAWSSTFPELLATVYAQAGLRCTKDLGHVLRVERMSPCPNSVVGSVRNSRPRPCSWYSRQVNRSPWRPGIWACMTALWGTG